jgi:hypothetical protein
MEYKVLPFVASIQNKGTSSQSAKQLEEVISAQSAAGWEYMRLESVSTFIAGDKGCFGLGGTPGHATAHQMIVFKKQ